MDKVDLQAVKEAVNLFDGLSSDLLDNMTPQAAFHAMAVGALVFGVKQFGPLQTANWFRILADEVDKRAASTLELVIR